jgi:DNA polymerase I
MWQMSCTLFIISYSMNRYQQLFKQLQIEKENAPSNVNDRIMVFDGTNAFIRAFGATPSTNEDGEHVGGISGFLYSIGKAIRDFKPSRCIIVFDGRGGSAKRKAIYKDYKGNRANKTRLRRHDHQQFPTLEDEQKAMRYQFGRLIDYLDNLPITILAIDGIEADDTIAYITQMYETTSKKIIIVSTDRDFYQLLSPVVEVWSPIKKKMYNEEALIQEFGVHPNNYVVYRTFTGDNSDNIPGVAGIGPKTILKAFPELESAIEFTLDDLTEKCNNKILLNETKNYQKVLDNYDTIDKNYRLMNIKLLNIPAQVSSVIRGILNEPITDLNKMEFQRIFMEDRMWNAMRNIPEWLNNTWLSLSAFAKQTHK